MRGVDSSLSAQFTVGSRLHQIYHSTQSPPQPVDRRRSPLGTSKKGLDVGTGSGRTARGQNASLRSILSSTSICLSQAVCRRPDQRGADGRNSSSALQEV